MTATRKNTPMMLPLQRLISNPANPRKHLYGIDELAVSIRSQGILQPLLVTPDGPARFKVLAGHRRAAAAKVAGMTNVPCVVRDQVDPTDEIAIMLIENMQRHELGPVERAEAMQRLIDQGYTQVDVARMLGLKHPASVNTYLAILELDEDSLEEVRAGNVAVGEARERVKESRRLARRTAGTPDRGRPVVAEPAHFHRRHPLAGTVEAACTHTTRPKPGGIGCGQCWEAAIRADEQARP